MEDTIVLYPAPLMGHLISMVELGKLLLTQKPSLRVNVILTPPPPNVDDSITQYINHITTTTPLITFHKLPEVPPNPASSSLVRLLMLDVLRGNNASIHEALLTISKSFNVVALVIDLFCTPALSVAEKLNIPTYCFFTSGVSVLAVFLYYPTIHDNTTESLRELDCKFDCPGLPPILAKDMPQPILDRSDQAYEYFLDFFRQIPKSKGVIVNSFDVLETRALRAISDGLCVPANCLTPPTYCIGPLIADSDKRANKGGGECLTWLDSQPSKSVVFLCFGSIGLFSLQQLQEMAIGLEKSEQRFLWVVRNPPPQDEDKHHVPKPDDPDLIRSLLPGGFLDRTKERGLVVFNWAPQVEVLSHGSVGGFVTHCGWNSVLEAIASGVPMLCWPLYAEQKLNKIVMVEEMKISLPLEVVPKDGLVNIIGSEQVEKGLRELMNSEKGASIRKQTMDMKEEAKKALSGSSRVALAKLVESWN